MVWGRDFTPQRASHFLDGTRTDVGRACPVTVRSSAASNPHCYVAVPILPSNSKLILCDLMRLNVTTLAATIKSQTIPYGLI
jgi:hypothetical protein